MNPLIRLKSWLNRLSITESFHFLFTLTCLILVLIKRFTVNVITTMLLVSCQWSAVRKTRPWRHRKEATLDTYFLFLGKLISSHTSEWCYSVHRRMFNGASSCYHTHTTLHFSPLTSLCLLSSVSVIYTIIKWY